VTPAASIASDSGPAPQPQPRRTLLVAIDFAQPQSYLAHGPTTRLAASLGAAIDWQPLDARPFAEPASETEGESRGARHRRMRAEYFERDLRRYAEALGLTLGEVRQRADSTVAGMGLLWLKSRIAAVDGTSPAIDGYVRRVFERHWRAGLPLDDAAGIRSLLDEITGSASTFDPSAMREEYERTVEGWRAAGLVNAPAFRVGDEVFIGRAHLPMIEWLLLGRVGPAPI
jgi:2-hydroxychromene-2-carboxylate isomerase